MAASDPSGSGSASPAATAGYRESSASSVGSSTHRQTLVGALAQRMRRRKTVRWSVPETTDVVVDDGLDLGSTSHPPKGHDDTLAYLEIGPWPFQCVFCLDPCTSPQAWELHERAHWHCIPSEESAWSWHCGFCDNVLARWPDRVAHLADHFRAGTSMASWDPLTPPYPFDRKTGCYAACKNDCWDAKTCLAMQIERYREVDVAVAIADQSPGCRSCDVHFPSIAEAAHHRTIWHSLRDVWTCPTGPTTIPIPIPGTEDICAFCDEDYSALSSSRAHHLAADHGIGTCEGRFFFRRGQFVLHLAGGHGLRLSEWSRAVVESCRRPRQTLAELCT